MQLFAAHDLKTTVIALEEGMRSGFGADHAVLVIFGDPDAFDDINAGRFFRVVAKNSEALNPFKTFLAGTSARCGQIRDSQRDFLFQEDAEEIGSTALVPLKNGAEIGFLAIGSADADRFHPGMSIDFLTRLGDLVAGCVKTLLGRSCDAQTGLINFIRHLEYERRLSPQTCKNYRRDLECTARLSCRDPVSILGRDGQRALSGLFRRMLSQGTRRPQHPTPAVRLPHVFSLPDARKTCRQATRHRCLRAKGKKRLPGNLDADRMARLLDIQGDGPIVDRDRAILELLYSSGLALAELTGSELRRCRHARMRRFGSRARAIRTASSRSAERRCSAAQGAQSRAELAGCR